MARPRGSACSSGAHYQQHHDDAPTRFPFDDQPYVSLRDAHAQGTQAFRAAFQAHTAKEEKLGQTHLQQDFEAAMRARLGANIEGRGRRTAPGAQSNAFAAPHGQ